MYEDRPITPNGAVMRCAPVALARRNRPDLLASDSSATCVVTHYAASCQWSCIILNTVIVMLLRGMEPDLRTVLLTAKSDGAPDMLAIALEDGIPAGVLSAIDRAAPVVSDAAWLRRMQRLIGHTLIALQSGLWAAVTPLDFETAMMQIVAAGGDTDTNGAVAGAVLGGTIRRVVHPGPLAGVRSRTQPDRDAGGRPDCHGELSYHSDSGCTGAAGAFS